MVINRKIKRTMFENKSQYVGSLVLIIISCLLYTMFNQLAVNMSNMTSSFEKNYAQEDASFTIDKNLNDIKSLEDKFNMKIEKAASFDYDISNNKTLRVFSENTKVDIPAIMKGEKLQSGYILIDPAFANANKLKIGDSIKVYGQSFKISGFMSLPNYIYPIKSESDLLSNANSFGIAAIGKDDFQRIGKGSSFYNIKFNNDNNLKEKISNFKAYLKENNFIILKWMNIDENPRVTYVTAKLESIKSISSSLPLAILLLTCFLTGIVIWRMLKREAVIIGTMYALGYRKKEIKKHYYAYSAVIAVIGGIIGTILGALFVRPILNFMVIYFNIPTDAFHIGLGNVVISIFLPLVFLFTASYFVINNELKYSPVDLMRGGKKKVKVNFIERNLKIDRLKFSTKFKLRQQLRNIPRSLLLLFGVTAATMLLLLGFASKSSIDFLMKDTITDAYKYNYEYVFNSLQKKEPYYGEEFSESVFTPKSDDKTTITAYGISKNTNYLVLKDKSGRVLRNEVVITRPLADKLKVKEGDTIELINKFDSKKYSIKVDGIAESYVGSNIYIPLSKFNKLLSYPEGSYLGLWSDKKLNIPEEKLLSYSNIEEVKKSFDSITEPMRYSIGSISFIAFIIGLIIIYVVTSMIIEENKENISLMKVLGYKKKEVYSLILNSSSFIVIAGYILGVPLVLASLNALFKSVTSTTNLSFPVKIDYIYVVLGFVIIYFTYELSKFLSRKKINTISMSEALKAGRE